VTVIFSYLADLIAIGILVLALYFPRHRRRDLVVAYIGVNVGVMAVSTALLSGAVGLGLGLGLFGVLSIIRLRSDELAQHEVAYYFSALALGLLSGLSTQPLWLTITLMTVIVASMWVGDNPALLRGYRRQIVTVDRAIENEQTLVAQLEQRLGADIKHITVMRLDLVNDTTTVDVRYRLDPSRTMSSTKAAEDVGIPAAETLR
jgi:hypothetical protein